MMSPDKLMSSRQRGKGTSGSNIGGNRQRIDYEMVATAINWNSKNGLNGGGFERGGVLISKQTIEHTPSMKKKNTNWFPNLNLELSLAF
jgi:hypothetical protein